MPFRSRWSRVTAKRRQNNLYGLHVALLALLLLELQTLHEEMYGTALDEGELIALRIAIESLVKDGFIKEPPAEASDLIVPLPK